MDFRRVLWSPFVHGARWVCRADRFVSGRLVALARLVLPLVIAAFWRWFVFLWPTFGLIPISRAVRLTYEGCQGTPFREYLDEFYKMPEAKLGLLFHFFDPYEVPVFAVRPPSAKLQPIGPEDGYFVLIPGTDDLASIHAQKRAALVSARVRKRDIRRLIENLRQLDPCLEGCNPGWRSSSH